MEHNKVRSSASNTVEDWSFIQEGRKQMKLPRDWRFNAEIETYRGSSPWPVRDKGEGWWNVGRPNRDSASWNFFGETEREAERGSLVVRDLPETFNMKTPRQHYVSATCFVHRHPITPQSSPFIFLLLSSSLSLYLLLSRSPCTWAFLALISGALLSPAKIRLAATWILGELVQAEASRGSAPGVKARSRASSSSSLHLLSFLGPSFSEHQLSHGRIVTLSVISASYFNQYVRKKMNAKQVRDLLVHFSSCFLQCFCCLRCGCHALAGRIKLLQNTESDRMNLA